MQQLTGVVAAVALLGAGLVPVPATAAGTLYVASSGSSDTNPCTQAQPCATISHAVSVAASGDTIQVGAGTFHEHVSVPKTLTIRGAGATTTVVNGDFSGTVFDVSGSGVEIDDLGVTQGLGTSNNGSGGGIHATGPLTLQRDSVVLSSSGTDGDGGGIWASSDLTVIDSSVVGNQAAFEGGGIAFFGTSFTMLRSTVWQNQTKNSGTGGGGLAASGQINIANSTIASNRSASQAGGLAMLFGQLSLTQDTFAGNQAPTGGGIAPGPEATASGTIVSGNPGGNCLSTLRTDNGYNLEDDSGASCGFSSSSHDVAGQDPLLGPVYSNGGPTETMALGAGSPAINAGRASACQAAPISDVDQRGSPRDASARGTCDIGAYDTGGTSRTVTVTTSTLPTATRGVPYSAQLEASGGEPPYSWTVQGALPAGLSLNSTTGAITGTPTSTGQSTFTVTANDSSGGFYPPGYRQLTITVTSNVTVTTTSLPAATQGVPYSAQLAASGGQAPYSWSLTQGSLPAGLSLNPATGSISGTPTATGQSAFTVQANDSSGESGTGRLTITVSGTPTPVTVTTMSLPAATQGVPYSAQLEASGGQAPYSWSLTQGSLPAGLSLNAATGSITGTPTATGQSTFTVEAADRSNGADAPGTRQLTIAVSGAAPSPNLSGPPASSGQSSSSGSSSRLPGWPNTGAEPEG